MYGVRFKSSESHYHEPSDIWSYFFESSEDANQAAMALNRAEGFGITFVPVELEDDRGEWVVEKIQPTNLAELMEIIEHAEIESGF